MLLLLLVGFAIIIFMLQQSRSDALGLSKETARELDHLKNQLGSLMATGAEEAQAQLAINQSQLTKAPFSFPRAQHSGEVLIFLKFPKVAGSTINEVIAAAAREHKLPVFQCCCQPDMESLEEDVYVGRTVFPYDMDCLSLLKQASISSTFDVLLHRRFGAHALFPTRQSTYIASWRDPIDRMHSAWDYSVCNKQAPPGMPFLEYR